MEAIAKKKEIREWFILLRGCYKIQIPRDSKLSTKINELLISAYPDDLRWHSGKPMTQPNNVIKGGK